MKLKELIDTIKNKFSKHAIADRIFKCACGYTEDRDIHAAKNVKFIGSIKRTECLEQASVETLSSTVKPAMVNGKIGQ